MQVKIRLLFRSLTLNMSSYCTSSWQHNSRDTREDLRKGSPVSESVVSQSLLQSKPWSSAYIVSCIFFFLFNKLYCNYIIVSKSLHMVCSFLNWMKSLYVFFSLRWYQTYGIFRSWCRWCNLASSWVTFDWGAVLNWMFRWDCGGKPQFLWVLLSGLCGSAESLPIGECTRPVGSPQSSIHACVQKHSVCPVTCRLKLM